MVAAASRAWWDAEADGYQREHAAALGVSRLVWGPEGRTEEELGLLGSVAGLRVVEVGCGAGQVSRWLADHGARAVGVDLSARQLQHALRLDGEHAGGGAPPAWIQADAVRLPFADRSFDLAVASYGALQFVAEPGEVHREVARVLRPGGRWVFSVTHPIRWAFLDDPGEPGLTAVRPYFDRRPYVERDDAGEVVYVETHRTLQDLTDDLRTAGFVVERLTEPEWPDGREEAWGPWSPQRGRLIPGTLVVSARLP